MSSTALLKNRTACRGVISRRMSHSAKALSAPGTLTGAAPGGRRSEASAARATSSGCIGSALPLLAAGVTAWKLGVSTAPAATTRTVMPLGASSAHSASPSAVVKAFEALYAACSAEPWKPAMLESKSMPPLTLPPPRASSLGATACAKRSSARQFRSTTTSSLAASVKPPMRLAQALKTKRPRPVGFGPPQWPALATASSITASARCGAPSAARSIASVRTSAPKSARSSHASASSGAGRLATSSRLRPSAASARASAAPKP
mmetsp:Transcript_22975/g.71003  ORF Transcript_22975/g.71003 Transcript_22975/m.71003 type:complete len:263 (+) Transcript_22975:118-906(+)